jgi:peptidoglycan/xylan/chitin deacetylase (PgdA/CDA1 family)
MIHSKGKAIYRKIRRRVDREVAMRVYQKPIHISAEPALVTFSFDDIHASAVETGAKLLEESGALGTFYISMGLSATEDAEGQYHTKEDLDSLLAAGHELAGHTFNHVACGDISTAAYLEDVAKNRASFSELFPEHELTNFSYPYGQISPLCKKSLSERFDSLRSTQSGINHGSSDLSMLKAVRLYENLQCRESVQRIIDDNNNFKGWLIFYTHDVSNCPSRFGCTPALLEQTISMVLESGASIVTASEALAFLLGRQDGS